MKKLTLLLALAVMSTGLTSCYKNWTCVCKITTTSPNSAPEVDYVHVDVMGFKSKAKKDCNAGDSEESYIGSIGSTTECSLAEED